MRGNPKDTLADVRSELKRMQGDVAKAKKVVVIGGGPVGVEYAGVSIPLMLTVEAETDGGYRKSELSIPILPSPSCIRSLDRSIPLILPKPPKPTLRAHLTPGRLHSPIPSFPLLSKRISSS